MNSTDTHTARRKLSDKALRDLRHVMEAAGMDMDVFDDDDLGQIGRLLLTVSRTCLKIERRLNNMERRGIIESPDVCSTNTKN